MSRLHLEHARKVGVAVPCNAHHINFGGECLNCGYQPIMSNACTIFCANPNPQNAVALARADHRASADSLTDWSFIEQLVKAEEHCIAYPKLVAALRDAAQILTRYGAYASATEFRMLLAFLKAQEVRS